MANKIRMIIFSIALLAIALACQAVMGGDTSVELPTDVASESSGGQPLIATDPPAAQPETSQQFPTSGSFAFSVTFTENGCPLTEPTPSQERVIEFIDDQVVIWHQDGEDFETYDQVSPGRYMRLNNLNKPVVTVFSSYGFVLEIYNEGDDPNQVAPCGYFTFDLVE